MLSNKDVIPFPDRYDDSDKDRFRDNLNTGPTTARSAVGEVNSAREELDASQIFRWHEEHLMELKAWDKKNRRIANLTTASADENCDGADVVCEWNKLDEIYLGKPVEPTSGKPGSQLSKPAFAQGSDMSTAMHARSQAGDSTQGNSGNSSSISLGAGKSGYTDPCSGASIAEKMSCIDETLSRIIADSNGPSCNATQSMQPTKAPAPQEMAGINQSQAQQIAFASPPTKPRLADSMPTQASKQYSGKRASFKATSVNRTRSVAFMPSSSSDVKAETPVNWYEWGLALLFKNTFARTPGTLLGDSTDTVLENDRQNLAFSDLLLKTANAPKLSAEANDSEMFNRIMDRMADTENTSKDIATRFDTALNGIVNKSHIQ